MGQNPRQMPVVAVVEDNADNRLLVRTILEDRFQVTEYETGDDALAGMQQACPDVVLLDISLPGMDGTAVLEAMKANDRLNKLPVIALTAHAMSDDRERFIKLGFDDYLPKPIVDENELIRAIETLLRR